MPNESKYALTAWNTEITQDLELPSGQLCLVMKPNPNILAELGLLDSVDPLGGLVEAKHINRVKGKQTAVNVDSLTKDPKAVLKVLETAAKIACRVVVEPSLKRPVREVNGFEEPLGMDREPGQVYTDMIEMHDLMFILNYTIGGNGQLEQFREQMRKTNRGVDSKPEIVDAAK